MVGLRVANRKQSLDLVCEFCLLVSVPRMCHIRGGQKRAPMPPELKLQAVLGSHAVLGTKSQAFSARAAGDLNS